MPTVSLVPIRCVAFDADDTLWDFSSAMTGGVEQAVAVAVTSRPDLVGRLVPGELMAAWDRIHEEHSRSPRPGEKLADLRPRSFEVGLGALEVIDAALVAAMADAYFAHRHGHIMLFDEVSGVLEQLSERVVLGLVTNGNTDPERTGLPGRFDFRLAADDVGVAKPDRRMFTMAAAAAGCHPAELVYVGDDPCKDVAAPQSVGCRGVWLNRTGAEAPAGIEPDATITDLTELAAVLDRFETEDHDAAGLVGLGPHPRPWPSDDHLDPDLLTVGDRRNVVDRYRYWREEAIVADLEARRHPFHVAIENWRHDRNIGAVVRNANAFGAGAVHIIGRRRWNRRGAMATDRYLTVHHHDSIASFLDWAVDHGLVIVGIDNVDGSVPLESAALPTDAVLVFGQEGPGLSDAALDAADLVCSITQFGSTRSINAGVASGIAMHAWVRTHVLDP